MFSGKNVVAVYNKKTSDRLKRFEVYKDKVLKNRPFITELDKEIWYHDNKPYISQQDVIGYKIEDFYSDGTLKREFDANVEYEISEDHLQTAVQRLGIDFIHMVGLEVAKLANIPFMAPNVEEYGHRLYISTNWGTFSSGCIGLDIVLYTPPVDFENRGHGTQQLASCYIPVQKVKPSNHNDYEKDGDVYREHIGLPGDIFKPLKLMYLKGYERDGTKYPDVGIIKAKELNHMVRALAVYIFDNYYRLKAVPRITEQG